MEAASRGFNVVAYTIKRRVGQCLFYDITDGTIGWATLLGGHATFTSLSFMPPIGCIKYMTRGALARSVVVEAFDHTEDANGTWRELWRLHDLGLEMSVL